MEFEQKQPEPQLTYPEAELVLGLVYPAGTDYSGVQLTLENYVKRFTYRPNPIRLSEYIDKILKKINVGVPLDDSSEAARINSRMTTGNKLCEKAEDEAFLVSAAVSEKGPQYNWENSVPIRRSNGLAFIFEGRGESLPPPGKH